MAKEPTGDEKTSDTPSPKIPLSEAAKIVKLAIHSMETQLIKTANQDDQGPVMLEGTTTHGFPVTMMIDPKIPAKVMLEYNYPTYSILEEDAPQEMWDELARIVGLGNVLEVDM